MRSGRLLSVVVIVVSDTTRSRRDTAHLEHTLEALSHQENSPAMEIIVPYVPPLAGIDALRERYPSVRFIAVRDLKRYPATGGREHHDELHARGIAVARGDLIAVIEDHGRPVPGWAATMAWTLQKDWAGVGGAIENEVDRPLNWAVYFCDFARFSNPLPRGESTFASDANSCYKRHALESIRPVWEEAFEELAVNTALRARGFTLTLSREAVLNQHRLDLTLREALLERFFWGRSFARSRMAKRGRVARWLMALLGPAIPIIYTAKIAATLLGRRRHGPAFLKTLPLVCLLSVSWAAGEMVGYLTSEGGASHGSGSKTGVAELPKRAEPPRPAGAGAPRKIAFSAADSEIGRAI